VDRPARRGNPGGGRLTVIVGQNSALRTEDRAVLSAHDRG
jgi:hypothetical protein